MGGGFHYTAEDYAAWPAPNYVNPETRDWGLVILCIVLNVLTWVFVGARLYARLRVQRNYGLDDTFMIVAMFPTLGVAIGTALASKKYGYDRHVWDVPPTIQFDTRKMAMAVQILYLFSTCLTKISILCFYRRMSSGIVSKTFRNIVWGSIAFIVLYMVIYFILAFVECKPFEAYWLRLSPLWAMTHKFECIHEPAAVISAGSISIIQDFIACGLPTMLFWKLHVPLRQKIALGAIFGVGGFICVAGILRVFYVYEFFYNSNDGTWTAHHIWIWTVVESHLAIICASAPALKVFFKKMLDASGLNTHFSNTLERVRHPSRKGYGAGTSQSQGTKDTPSVGYNASASRRKSREMPQLKAAASWTRDVELSAIKVAHEVDVIYEVRDMDTDCEASSGHSSMELRRDEKRMIQHSNDIAEGRLWQK